jgi:RNA polymerase sigma factor (sigma-70 family)
MAFDEREIVLGCRRNDRGSQRRLYDAYAGRMLVVCLRYTKDRADAEDVLQDAFVKVFDKIGTYRFESPLLGWIKAIVVNTALNHLRSRRPWQFTEDLDQTAAQELDPATTPLSGLHLTELMALIGRLPAGCRTVFNLYAIEGYPHHEIAELLGISEGTSKSQYSRARYLLQKLLSEPALARKNA